MTAHLRLNAIYWGFTATHIMKRPDALAKEELIAFVLSCWDDVAGALAVHDSEHEDEEGPKHPAI